MTSKYSQEEQRRIKLTSIIGLIVICNMLIYSGIYFMIDIRQFGHAIVFLTLSSAMTFGIILVNKKGYYNLAKILLATYTTFSMWYVTAILFGKDPGFQVFLLLGTIIPVFLWSFKQKEYLFIFITLNIVLYIILEFFPPILEHKIDISPNYISIFKSTNIIACFMGLSAAIVIYQYFINLKEKQLIQQAEELKISQAHKDLVYSIIAHDLRGPFGTFAGLTKLYLEDYEDYSEEKREEVIATLSKTSSSLQRLLENLLEWSKMQSGKFDQNFIYFNIKQTVEDAINLHQELILNRNHSISIDIDQDLKVYADQYMISTVFRNLISNAIKFTPNKGEIEITTKVKHDEVEICISDSGVGMSENDVKNLFNINETIKNPVNRKDKGSGLGLLICKDFVEINQGKIWVESVPGKGSKFYFTLKLTNNIL